MGVYGGGGDGGAAAQAAQQQANLQKGMGQIKDLFSQYDPAFYAKIGQNYTDWASPQLMGQYRDTKNSLAYSLARNGILKSGAAVASGQALTDQLNNNLTTVANNAVNQENQMKQNVAQAQGNLTNELIASNDPSVVGAQGAAMTAGLTTNPNFTPLGNMFGDWSSAYIASMNARAFNPNTPSLWQQLSNSGYGYMS